jgi:zinc protease
MDRKKLSLPKLDIRSLPGPETIHRSELANGIVVLVRENFSSPSVVFSGYIPGGSFGEPIERAGQAELAVSALMRGTQKRGFQAIYESIESVGANLTLGTGKHTISFFGKGLEEDLHHLLDLFSEVLRFPAFPEDQVDRLKAEKLTGLALRDQNTGAMAQLVFNELAYNGHPYSVPTDGYSEALEGATIRDLENYHETLIGPTGMVIAVVGAVKKEQVFKILKDKFGPWNNPKQQPLADIDSQTRPGKLVRKEASLAGKVQSDVVIGAPGPSRFNPGYLAAALGNSILGRFGLFGRIGDRVRESAGLAYYSYSSVSGGPGPGAWQVIAGVNPANVELAIDLIRDEIRKFTSERVTLEELADNQANFIGRLPLQLETNEGVAGALIHLERYKLGLDYYQRYPQIIREITRDQILEVAKEFLDPDHLAIAIAGPELRRD